MNNRIVAKELIKIAKSLVAESSYGEWGDRHYYFEGEQGKELGKLFLASEYYNKLHGALDAYLTKLSERNASLFYDSGCFVKPGLKYLESAAAKKIYFAFLKKEFSKNKKTPQGYAVNPIEMAQDFLNRSFACGDFLREIKNTMMEQITGDKNWRRYQ